jgi:hypothetical protein
MSDQVSPISASTYGTTVVNRMQAAVRFALYPGPSGPKEFKVVVNLYNYDPVIGHVPALATQTYYLTDKNPVEVTGLAGGGISIGKGAYLKVDDLGVFFEGNLISPELTVLIIGVVGTFGKPKNSVPSHPFQMSVNKESGGWGVSLQMTPESGSAPNGQIHWDINGKTSHCKLDSNGSCNIDWTEGTYSANGSVSTNGDKHMISGAFTRGDVASFRFENAVFSARVGTE